MDQRGFRCAVLSFMAAILLLILQCGCSVDEPEIVPVQYGPVADIYIPNTGIVNPPTVVQYIDATTGLPKRSRCPAVSILAVDERLQVVDGERVLTDVVTFMALYRDITIPAFLIDSQQEADALIAYLQQAAVIDAYVMADFDHAALVEYVRKEYRYIQGALWTDNLQDRSKILFTANSSLAAVVCTDQPLTLADTAYFNARMVSLWSAADDRASVYGAISAGYNGVICRDTDTVYDVYETVTVPAVCGKSIVVGHRGCYGYFENTIVSFWRAHMEFGCSVVELDLRMTADGEIVLMHDATVDRTTNGTGAVADMTLSQLRQFGVDVPKASKAEPIPTFEEVLQAFANTDIVLNCHINVRSDAMARRFSELVKQYGYEDRVIAFYSYDYIREYNYQNHLDGIVFAAGNNEKILQSSDSLQVLENMIRNLVPFHYQPLFYDYVGDGAEGADHANSGFYYQMCARGFLNWHSTTTGRENVENTLLTNTGATGALLNDLSLAKEFIYGLDTQDLTLKVRKPISRTVVAVGQFRKKALQCDYLQISGPELQEGTLLQRGKVQIVYYAQCTTDGGQRYLVFSKPITVTFK